MASRWKWSRDNQKDDPDQYATGIMDDGSKFLIDRRAAARLPSRFGLTVHGLGRLKHLDLEGEQWGNASLRLSPRPS
jgi:hypothetical protein